MAGNEIQTQFIGNLTADPEVKHLANNIAVLNVRIAATPRVFDRDAGEYKDGETTFIKLTAWRNLAENIAASLKKGNRVIGWGTLKQDEWTDDDGVKRTVHYIDVDEIGPSLQWATADVAQVKGGSKAKPVSAPEAEPEAAPAANGKTQAKAAPKAAPAVEDDEF